MDWLTMPENLPHDLANTYKKMISTVCSQPSALYAHIDIRYPVREGALALKGKPCHSKQTVMPQALALNHSSTQAQLLNQSPTLALNLQIYP